jgi:hypothetical protein
MIDGGEKNMASFSLIFWGAKMTSGSVVSLNE